jgi:hypothetical protein
MLFDEIYDIVHTSNSTEEFEERIKEIEPELEDLPEKKYNEYMTFINHIIDNWSFEDKEDRRDLNESEESEEFVVTNDTSVDELESYLNEKIEGRYSYGSESTLEDIVNYLVYNSLLASGKSEEDATSMSDDFVRTYMDSDATSIPDEFDMYERKTEGKNSFDSKVIFEFSCGGDGYGFSGFFYDLTGLLNGIKDLLNQ